MNVLYGTAITGATAFLLAGAPLRGGTVVEDFEGLAPGSTLPEGWSLVAISNPDRATYTTTTGKDGGQGGRVAGRSGDGKTVGAYIVNSGMAAFDASKPISGSFDFYLVDAVRYDAIAFLLGDITTGRNRSPGVSIEVNLRERTFGARARLLNGAGSDLVHTENVDRYTVRARRWTSARFTWTPTTGTTGIFRIDWRFLSSAESMEYSGFTFDSLDVHFGFGGTGTMSSDGTGVFDNIRISGTPIEPNGAFIQMK